MTAIVLPHYLIKQLYPLLIKKIALFTWIWQHLAAPHSSEKTLSFCPCSNLPNASKNCWCWRHLAAFCPPAPFSAAVLISAEAISTHPLRFPLSLWMLLSFAPRGQSQAKFIVFSTKEFVSSVPAAPQRRLIPWVGLLCLFYPAFLLAVAAECCVSDSNECIQTNDGLIPPYLDKVLNTQLAKQNFSWLSSTPVNRNRDTPKYKSSPIHKGFAWHTVVCRCPHQGCAWSPPSPPKIQDLCNRYR